MFKITSVTTELSRQYNTPCGNFEFVHLPLPYYAFDICSQVLTARQTVLMASPEKALCDKIITTAGIQLRSMKTASEFLMEDLRIDPEQLRKLDTEKITGWLSESPKRKSVELVVKAINGIAKATKM